jgi:hypothetical protein
MNFFVVHEFYEMRGAWWWLFRASMLHEKTDLSRKDKSNPIWFWILEPFWVFLVNGFVCGYSKDISEVFLDWNDFKIRFFEQKKCYFNFPVITIVAEIWARRRHVISPVAKRGSHSKYNLYVAPAVLYEICTYVLGG